MSQQQAQYLLLVQVAETVISLGIIYGCVAKYKDDMFSNPENDWFVVDFSHPLDTGKNGWLVYHQRLSADLCRRQGDWICDRIFTRGCESYTR